MKRNVRKSRNLPLKREMFIYCEGYTEVNYFKMLKRKYRSSNIKVKSVKAKKSDALGVVNYAIDSSTSTKQDTVFVVFDKDDHSPRKLSEAIDLARSYEFGVGYSNTSFDLWILNHFEKVSRHMNQRELERKLTKLFEVSSYSDDIKNSELDKYLFDRVDNALENTETNTDCHDYENIKLHIENNPFHTIKSIVEKIFL